MSFLINWLLSGLAIVITAYLLPGVPLSGIKAALLTAIALGLINAVIKPVLKLLTLPFTIMTLGLFSLVLKKKIDFLTIPLALKRYVQWSMVRLGLLEVAIVLNVLCYYLTLSNTGNLCMLIGLTASLFCLPSEKRLRNELHINKE